MLIDTSQEEHSEARNQFFKYLNCLGKDGYADEHLVLHERGGGGMGAE